MRKPNKCDYCPKQYCGAACGGNCNENLTKEDWEDFNRKESFYNRFYSKEREDND